MSMYDCEVVRAEKMEWSFIRAGQLAFNSADDKPVARGFCSPSVISAEVCEGLIGIAAPP
jgi:hypothetical protein